MKGPPRVEVFASENKEYLDAKAVLTIIILTLIWGSNHPAIKYSNQGISPVFASNPTLCYCFNLWNDLLYQEGGKVIPEERIGV